MRLVIGVLAAFCLSSMPVARADPAQSTPPSTAPASATATSAAQPAPAATPSAPAPAAQQTQPAKQTVVVQGTPEFDALEKHFLSEGYKLEMHNGEKYFCRREDELGSRLGGHKACSTAQQLMVTEQEAKAAYVRGQMQQVNPSAR
jgi:hypothetical protein